MLMIRMLKVRMLKVRMLMIRMLKVRMLKVRMLKVRMLMAWLFFGPRGVGRADGNMVTATEASRTIFIF
jgi:hypothetical protein